MKMLRRRNHIKIFRRLKLQKVIAIEIVTSVKSKVVLLCDALGNDLESRSDVLHTEWNVNTSIDWVFYTLTA